VGYLAGFSVGVALPLLVDWYAWGGWRVAWAAAGVGAVAGVAAGLARRRLPSARRVTLLILAALVIGYWGLA
jgi:hypothetical protein